MDDPVRKAKRRKAWKVARTAVRMYERDQSPTSAQQVEAAMQKLRDTQDEGHWLGTPRRSDQKSSA